MSASERQEFELLRPADKQELADIEARKLRGDVAQHLSALGLADGLGVIVHRLDDRHPNPYFRPESTTSVLV